MIIVVQFDAYYIFYFVHMHQRLFQQSLINHNEIARHTVGLEITN